MLQTPQEYVDTLTGPGRDWLVEFLDYMEEHHPGLPPVMFRQRPMFKVGKSYVFFTVAKEHFTVHTLNFDLIEGLKTALPRAGFGRGSVKVKFADEEAKPVLKALCDEVVRLNSLPNPPPVDVVPERPYAEKLADAFKGSKAKWQPLYVALRDAAKARLAPFEEYFPAVNVLWKCGATFAQVSAVAAGLRVEFFAAAEHPEYQPIKMARLSKNRVAHTVEIIDAASFPQLLAWVEASYALVQPKG